MSNELDELSLTIGKLLNAQEDAAEERSEVRRILNALSQQLAALAADVKNDRALATQAQAILIKERDEAEKRLSKVESDLTELKIFKAHVGKIMGIASAVMTGVAYLIWQGLAAFGGDIKTFLSRLFH